MRDDPATSGPEALLANTRWARSLARSLVLDASRVDDVVQETWVAALERPPKRLRSPRAWLGGVIKNVERQRIRSDERRERRERRSAKPEPLPSTEELVEKADTQKRIVQAVLGLDEPYRSTLLLHFFEDLSAREIADRDGLPASTVRNRLKRGLEKLRARFDAEHGGNRRAWSLGMASLARMGRGADAALLSGSTRVASIGGMKMSVQAAIAIAAASVAGLSTVALSGNGGGAPSAPAQAVILSIADTEGVQEKPAQDSSSRTPVKRPAQTKHTLTGRVVDEAGKPVPGASVFVGGQPSPFPGKPEVAFSMRHGRFPEGNAEYWSEHPEALRKSGIALGKVLTTDAEGKFAAQFAEERRVYAALMRTTGLAPLNWVDEWSDEKKEPVDLGVWHPTPAKNVDFVARRIPTAKVTVWVTDQTTGERLKGFGGTLTGTGERPRHWETEGSLYEETLELTRAATADVQLAVTAPTWAKASREVLLTPGAHREVELLVSSGDGFTGEVLDPFGNPVPDAFVYWGEELQMRRNSHFRAFDVRNVPGGVRTDADGRFKLRGSATKVTVWHAEHSPKTVARAQAASIRLPARGVIRGRVLDEQGLPVAGASVALDRAREALTDAQGVYVFENVEAGHHGLRLQGERFVGLRVPAGQTVDVAYPPVIEEVTIRLESGGVLQRVKRGGVLFGLDDVYSVHEWGAPEGVAKVRRVVPGRFLMLSNAGIIAMLSIDGPEAVADLGTARLTVRTRTDDAFIAPVSDNPLVLYWSERMHREVPDAGELTWSPIPSGRYAIGVSGKGIVQTVTVDDVLEVEIP